MASLVDSPLGPSRPIERSISWRAAIRRLFSLAPSSHHSRARGMFDRAQNTNIQNATFTINHYGGVVAEHSGTVGAEGESPNSGQGGSASSGHQEYDPSPSPRRESPDVYVDRLLTKNRGYPLWIPSPSTSLPILNRKLGVSLGDVGIFTPEGGFDYLFNIFHDSTHPINAVEGVPPGFIPFKAAVGPEFVEWNAGSYLADSSIIRVDDGGDPSKIILEATCPEAAVLMIPKEIRTARLRITILLRKYIEENIAAWYKFVRHTLGYDLENGGLQVVYGCRKSSGFGIATTFNTGRQANTRLTFSVNNDWIDLLGCPYRWTHTGSAEVKAGPSQEENSEILQTEPARNQCLFVSTINTRLSPEIWRQIIELGIAKPIDEQSGVDSMQKSTGESNIRGAINPSSREYHEAALHPSTILLDTLETIVPGLAVYMTCDDDWADVITTKDMTAHQLITQVLEKKKHTGASSENDIHNLQHQSLVNESVTKIRFLCTEVQGTGTYRWQATRTKQSLEPPDIEADETELDFAMMDRNLQSFFALLASLNLSPGTAEERISRLDMDTPRLTLSRTGSSIHLPISPAHDRHSQEHSSQLTNARTVPRAVTTVPSSSTFQFKAPFPISSPAPASVTTLKHRQVSLASPSSPRIVKPHTFRDEMGLSHDASSSFADDAHFSLPEKKGKMRKLDTKQAGDKLASATVEKKWSSEETQMLVKGCNKYGVGNWKIILQDPELEFHDRSAVDLKDRFRTYFPDAYKKHYPNAKTHLSTKVRATFPDGSSIFEKTRSKRRRPFTEAEDRALKAGYDRHGTTWSTIVKDPIFQEQNRRSTDLRDRFRNAFPDLYQAAGYNPRTAVKKKADGPVRAADDQLSMSAAGPVRSRRRAQSAQGQLRGGTKSVPQSTSCSADEESSGDEDEQENSGFKSPPTPVFVDNVFTMPFRSQKSSPSTVGSAANAPTLSSTARDTFSIGDDDDEMQLITEDADPLTIPDFHPNTTHSDMETWPSGLNTPTHSSTAGASTSLSQSLTNMYNMSFGVGGALASGGEISGLGLEGMHQHQENAAVHPMQLHAHTPSLSSIDELGLTGISLNDRTDSSALSAPGQPTGTGAGGDADHDMDTDNNLKSDGTANMLGMFFGRMQGIHALLNQAAGSHVGQGQQEVKDVRDAMDAALGGDLLGLEDLVHMNELHATPPATPLMTHPRPMRRSSGGNILNHFDHSGAHPSAGGHPARSISVPPAEARNGGAQQQGIPMSMDDVGLHMHPHTNMHFGGDGGGLQQLDFAMMGRNLQSFFALPASQNSSPGTAEERISRLDMDTLRLTPSRTGSSIHSPISPAHDRHSQELSSQLTPLFPAHLILSPSPPSNSMPNHGMSQIQNTNSHGGNHTSLSSIADQVNSDIWRNAFAADYNYNLSFLDLHYYNNGSSAYGANGIIAGHGSHNSLGLDSMDDYSDTTRQGQALDLAQSAALASSTSALGIGGLGLNLNLGLPLRAFDTPSPVGTIRHQPRETKRPPLVHAFAHTAPTPMQTSQPPAVTSPTAAQTLERQQRERQQQIDAGMGFGATALRPSIRSGSRSVSGIGSVRQSPAKAAAGPGAISRSMSHHRGQSAVNPQDLILRNDNKRKRASWDGGNGMA